MVRPTRLGSPIPILDTGVLGYDPNSIIGDLEDPIDRAAEGVAYIPHPLIDDISIVQFATADGGGSPAYIDVTLASAPTPGNLLVCWQTHRDASVPTGPAGWTAHPDGVAAAVGTTGYTAGMFYKIATIGESATVRAVGGDRARASVVEIAGASVRVGNVELQDQNGNPLELSLTSSGTADMIIVGGFGIRVTDAGFNATTPDANTTELVDDESTGFSPQHWLGYRIVSSPSGAYTIGATSSQVGRDWAGQALAFEGDPASVVWFEAPSVIDGADGTFDYVLDSPLTETLRLVLADEYRIASARLRIAIENSGSVTYEVQGATLADFSDAVTLDSVTFTALGSFTAQDVAFDWVATTGYTYYQLVGPVEDRRIHAFELYEALESVTDHPDLTGRDTADSHPAAAVSFTPSGTIAATTVQAAIEEVAAEAGTTDHGALTGLGDDDHSAYETVTAGGGPTAQDHGSMGATETIDAANGNRHRGVLDADCTITIAPFADGSIDFAVTQDGTGGWGITWSGVTFAGDDQPDQTVGGVTFYVLVSDDGVVYGFKAGGGGSALTIEDEGTPLATAAASIDFVGAGVTASGTGADKTVTIPGVTAAAVSALGFVGALLIDDTHSTPLVFADLLQTEEGDDLLYADV